MIMKHVEACRKKILYMVSTSYDSYMDGMYQLFLSLLVMYSTQFTCPHIKPFPSHMSLKHVKLYRKNNRILKHQSVCLIFSI